MATLMEYHAGGDTLIGPSRGACLRRVENRGAHAPRPIRVVLGHAPTLRRNRVDLARRRLAAGCYDSDELLDTVLDMVIEDLTS